MGQTVITADFNPTQRATLSITMTCIEWDELGMALAGMKGKLFQTTADVILQGLVEVGYFTVKAA